MCAGSTLNNEARKNFNTHFGKGLDPIGNMKNTVRALTPQVPQQSLSIQQAPQPKAKTAKKPTEPIYS